MKKIIIVLGLPGSGKSFFAKRLAIKLGALYISTDQVRNELAIKKDYTLLGKEKIYKLIIEMGHHGIKNGQDLVFDGTFYLEALRDLIRQNFESVSKLYFIEVSAPELLIKERIQRKRTDSDADFKVYQAMKKDFEPLKSSHLKLPSTNGNIDEMIRYALDYLSSKND